MADLRGPVFCPATQAGCDKDECCYLDRKCQATGLPVLDKLGIDAMLIEAERELAMRKQVYPSRVANKKMSKDAADYHLHAMSSIIRFLRWCKPREVQLRTLEQDGSVGTVAIKAED